MDKDIIEKGYEKVKEVASSALGKAKEGVASLTESAEEKTFRERFDEVKDEIKKAWPSLSDIDLKSINKEREKLIVLLAEKYGENKEAVNEKLQRIFDSLKNTNR